MKYTSKFIITTSSQTLNLTKKNINSYYSIKKLLYTLIVTKTKIHYTLILITKNISLYLL